MRSARCAALPISRSSARRQRRSPPTTPPGSASTTSPSSKKPKLRPVRTFERYPASCAHAWYAAVGITIERVLSDNGACYRSVPWAETCQQLGITHKRTRPYRPQTNGKVERFHRTLADEWAHARLYTSDTERCTEFPIWLHTYNHHRGHTALGGQPPASRVPNLSGQYS